MQIQHSRFYFFLATIAIFATSTEAANQVPQFETTRMKGTAGAGVASLLMDEATYLNPASIAFYQKGSIYYQHSGIDSTQKPKSGSTADPSTEEFSSRSVILSDAKGNTGGSFSYNDIDYQGQSRRRFAGAFAHPVGKKSSLGVTASYIKESVFNKDGVLENRDYKQTTFGILHVVDESLSFGFTVHDPFKEKENETRATTGFQYVIKDIFTIMLDAGADYNTNLSDTVVWRAATQVRLFSDFFARFGTFNDKGLKQKGTGVGVGWNQPRLNIEIALKNSELLESDLLQQSGEDIKESSFSLSYRF